MNIFKLIFGDRFAEEVGRTLLEHFERKDFPIELLQYPDINLHYCEYMYKKACRAGEPEGQELIDYLDALIEIRKFELGDESEKSDP